MERTRAFRVKILSQVLMKILIKIWLYCVHAFSNVYRGESISQTHNTIKIKVIRIRTTSKIRLKWNIVKKY